MLKEKIQDDLKTALKNKDEAKTTTLRLILNSVQNREIEKRGSDNHKLDDKEVENLVQKEAKKRKEAIELYKKGERADLVEKETAELKIIEEYLPEQISEEEISKLINQVIQELKPEGPKDFGKTMGAIMKKAQGQADASVISKILKPKLEKTS